MDSRDCAWEGQSPIERYFHGLYMARRRTGVCLMLVLVLGEWCVVWIWMSTHFLFGTFPRIVMEIFQAKEGPLTDPELRGPRLIPVPVSSPYRNTHTHTHTYQGALPFILNSSTPLRHQPSSVCMTIPIGSASSPLQSRVAERQSGKPSIVAVPPDSRVRFSQQGRVVGRVACLRNCGLTLPLLY